MPAPNYVVTRAGTVAAIDWAGGEACIFKDRSQAFAFST